MRAWPAWCAAVAASAVIGFMAGRGTAGFRATRDAAPSSAAIEPASATPALHAAAAPAPAPLDTNELPVAAPDSALVTQRRAGAEIVDNAIALGQWTDRDADALFAATGDLGTEDQLELQRRLAAAVNEDRVKLVKETSP